ncbi:MAG: alcohol dehydrogenase catalytic domain-containing protein [Deltaproteobacteria bacterium]|nr:alcohol dehydrogenase catalytic domain-containing protein [Deltaproteobacteria bacterium]
MTLQIPDTMKAVVLHDWNDLRYEDVETPHYGPDEVLCRVLGCGICATDIHMVKGDFEGLYPPALPFILGHEWFGEVAAMGDRVDKFSIGDRVIGEPQKGCGTCARCLEGRYHLCMNSTRPDKGYKLYGHNVNGAYAEYVSAVEATLYPMPDNLGLEEGVSACNVGIGTEAVRRGRVKLGDDVLVIGVGLLGMIVLQLAKISGAGRVIAVGRGHRLEVAGKLGADILVDRSQADTVKQVMDITGGLGVDVVFECAGAQEAVEQSMDCVRRGGRVLLAGLSRKMIPMDADRIVLDEIEVIGSRGAPNAVRESITLLAGGRINVKPLVTHQLPLSEAARGMEIFEKRLEDVIRVALIP